MNYDNYTEVYSCDQLSTYAKVYYVSLGFGLIMTSATMLQYILCIFNKFHHNAYNCAYDLVCGILCKLLNGIAYFAIMSVSLGAVVYLSKMYSCNNGATSDTNLVLTALLLLFFDIIILFISCTICFEKIHIVAYIIFALAQVIIRFAILCMLCVAPLRDLSIDQICVDIVYITCGIYISMYTLKKIKDHNSSNQ